MDLHKDEAHQLLHCVSQSNNMSDVEYDSLSAKRTPKKSRMSLLGVLALLLLSSNGTWLWAYIRHEDVTSLESVEPNYCQTPSWPFRVLSNSLFQTTRTSLCCAHCTGPPTSPATTEPSPTNSGKASSRVSDFIRKTTRDLQPGKLISLAQKADLAWSLYQGPGRLLSNFLTARVRRKWRMIPMLSTLSRYFITCTAL